jgi:hypothetical protein
LLDRRATQDGTGHHAWNGDYPKHTRNSSINVIVTVKIHASCC